MQKRARRTGVTEYLTVRAAAGRLGVGYSTLKQWIYAGAVRTVTTTGGHHRIAESEIDRQRLSAAAPLKSGNVSRPIRSGRGAGALSSASSVGVLVSISGRNQLRGLVEEVRGDGLLAQVRLRIGDQTLTAVITRDALSELKLKRGDEAVAIIKSTEVMIGREQRQPTRAVRK